MADRELRRVVGRITRFLRDYHGLTQNEVADRAGIPGMSWMVSKLETAKWADSRMWETLDVVAPGLATTADSVRKVARRMLEKQRVSGAEPAPASFIKLLVEGGGGKGGAKGDTSSPGTAAAAPPAPATTPAPSAAPSAPSAPAAPVAREGRTSAPSPPGDRPRRTAAAAAASAGARTGARTVIIPDNTRGSGRRRGGGRSNPSFASNPAFGARSTGLLGQMMEVPVPAPAPGEFGAEAPSARPSTPPPAAPAAPPVVTVQRDSVGAARTKPRSGPSRPVAPAATRPAASPAATPAPAAAKRPTPAPSAPGPQWRERLAGSTAPAGSVLELCQRYAEVHLLARLEDPPESLDLAEVQELIRTVDMLRELAERGAGGAPGGAE